MLKIRTPWTIEFLRKHNRYMTLPSAWRYCRRVRLEAPGRDVTPETICLRLRPPVAGDTWLRYGTSDETTLTEVVFEQVYRPVVEAVPGCRFVFDLGANIGLASRYFAAAYPGCRILAVEPDDRNLALFNRNLAAVPADRWAVLRAAVWHCDEPVALRLPAVEVEYHGIQVAAPTASDTVTVPGVTPAGLIERSGFPHVDLMKVDIEGAEAGLFQGDTAWLARVNAIAIEFHHDSRAASDFDRVVAAHGFTVRDLNHHTTLATRT